MTTLVKYLNLAMHFLYNNIYNGISHTYFCKSFITVDHPWSAPLSLSSMGIAAQMSGIAPIKLLLNKSNELNCMVEENNNESLVKLLNLYEWVPGLTKSGQNSFGGGSLWRLPYPVSTLTKHHSVSIYIRYFGSQGSINSLSGRSRLF